MDRFVDVIAGMVDCGVPVNHLRTTFNILWVVDSRSDFTHFDNLPHCWCLGDRKLLREAWGLVLDDVRVLLVKAESKSMELRSTNLGPKRSFTVAETVLWTCLLGPQLAAQVVEVVSLEDMNLNLNLN